MVLQKLETVNAPGADTGRGNLLGIQPWMPERVHG
jgi:hypothetical protein